MMDDDSLAGEPKSSGKHPQAMNDEFSMMGGQDKPPPETQNVVVDETEQHLVKKKKKHHKKKKDSSLVQQEMDSTSFAQKVQQLFKNDSVDIEKKIQDFSDQYCTP